jgi:predicted permease
MVENALLAAGGTALGILIAYALSSFLVAFLGTEGSSLWIDLRPDGKLIAYSALVAVACCAAFGLLPAWRAARADAGDALKANGRSTPARAGSALREILVVVQVTLSLALVFGALLFSRTLGNVLAVDPGFRHAGVLTAWLDYSRLQVPPAARWSFQRELLESIRATPGVAAAAEANPIPLTGSGGTSTLWREGAAKDQSVTASTQYASEGYIETMGVRLLAGRDFDSGDTRTRPRVALVNQALAKKLELGLNPVGRRFRKEANPWEPEMTFEIIGLVNDTKYFHLKEEYRPIAYYSTAQDSDPGPRVQVLVRSRTAAAGIAAVLRKNLKAKYPAIGADFRVLDTTIQNGLLRERLLATVSGFFGLLAALIAAVGLYGVISYLVTRRTHEIGIRMALGASPRHIVRTVISRALLLVLLGVIAGTAAGVVVAHAARSMLFGLEPDDPATLALSVAALLAVALTASSLPALRAVRLDTLAALRKD